MLQEKLGTAKPEYARVEGGGVGPVRSPLWLRKQRKRRILLWVIVVLCVIIVGTLLLGGLYFSSQSHVNSPFTTPTSTHAPSSGWTMYMANNGRSSFNASETIITPTSAPHLKLQWTHAAPGTFSSIVSQTVEANGLLYWGSWNGFEYATNAKNQVVWSTNLGSTINLNCDPPHLGVTSTAAIANVQIKGTTTSVDFVGGGDGNLYALDAHSGAVIWKTPLGAAPAHYLWSSPAIYHGSIYIGVSSDCDLPLVQGGLVQVDATTGKIQHTFNTVPQGCVGASVWDSPTIDEAAGTVYISTGNLGNCSSPEPYAQALVELRASDLSLLHSWQVPKSEWLPDGDFPTTPTLFSTSTGLPMVGLAHKDGMYYAFKRDDLSKPVWQAMIANHRGIQSSSAWDGHRLYVVGQNIVVKNIHCHGSIAALNPDTGAFIWQHCLNSGSVLGAVAAVPGLVVYTIGKHVIVLDATSGQVLFLYQTNGSRFWGWPSISNGVLYVGSIDGSLYAFAP